MFAAEKEPLVYESRLWKCWDPFQIVIAREGCCRWGTVIIPATSTDLLHLHLLQMGSLWEPCVCGCGNGCVRVCGVVCACVCVRARACVRGKQSPSEAPLVSRTSVPDLHLRAKVQMLKEWKHFSIKNQFHYSVTTAGDDNKEMCFCLSLIIVYWVSILSHLCTNNSSLGARITKK